MDFAKKQLEKYGWSEGKGLGLKEDGIATALKPKLKFDNAGVGHNIGAEFTDKWWERMFNNAASSIVVNAPDNKYQVVDKARQKQHKIPTPMEYGSFVKTAKLTQDGLVEYRAVLETEPLKSYSGLTDDELFQACGGRTAHKGARHGLKLSGKLSRIEKQEKLLLKKMKQFSLTDDCMSKAEKKLKKLKRKEDCTQKLMPIEEESTKKIKKRKSVSFNENVTKIYSQDLDTSFDSEIGSLRDENSNDAQGSDEGIEYDLENNNNNNDLESDNHRAFEEARLSDLSDLSKAERKKLKKKRKLQSANAQFFTSISEDDKDTLSKKRKHVESNSIESSEIKKKNKKKRNRQRIEEANISSITKSLEGFCRISDSEKKSDGF